MSGAASEKACLPSVNPIDGDLRHRCFTMVFHRTEISIFGAQSEMKNVRFLSCLLTFCIFCKTLSFQTDGGEKDRREISYNFFIGLDRHPA